MQRPPPFVEQAAVGHLVRQGVLEGVDTFWKEVRLVEQLGRLQAGETTMQRHVRQRGNGVHQGTGDFGANDRGGLEEVFLVRWQPINARRQDRLHGGWHLDGGQGVRQTVGAWHTNQHARLDQGADTLLQEEGIALRTRDQEAFGGSRPGASPAGPGGVPRHSPGGSGSSRSCV